jgi:hypothetical protein
VRRSGIKYQLGATAVCLDNGLLASSFMTRKRAASLLRSSKVLIRQNSVNYSRTITFSSEECTFSVPLYSIRPSLRNLFMK